jgi:hypothetical protein
MEGRAGAESAADDPPPPLISKSIPRNEIAHPERMPRMSVHRLTEFISRIVSAIWRRHLDDADFDPESILAEMDSKKRDRISN